MMAGTENRAGLLMLTCLFLTLPLAAPARAQAGYREGISAGRASTVQAGFDEGYSVHGAPLGRELGQLRGLANGLLVLLTSAAIPLPQPPSWASSTSGKDAAVEAARDLVRRLGKLRVQDVAPPDEEAERHAREHGEDALLPPELQEKREMESLEDGLEAILSSGSARQTPNGRLEMDACRNTLQELLGQVGLQSLLPAPAAYRPTTAP